MHTNHLSRRTFSLLTIAAVPTLAITATTRAQTPVSTISGGDFALYHQQRDDLLAAGRALIGAYVAGDDDSFADLIDDPGLAAVVPSSELAWLETNRIRLRWPEIGLLMDGGFDGTGSMAGYFQQGGASTFNLTAESDQSGTIPEGRWTGIIGPGEIDLEFALTFAGDETSLTATLDVPSQGMNGVAIPDVTFHPALPLGDLLQDRALPLAPTNLSYAAEYSWGDALLVLQAIQGPAGGFIWFTSELRDHLPPDPGEGLGGSTDYRLPIDDPVLVFWGGPTEFQNYHAISPAQRHALDMVVWENGATYRTDGQANEDYLIWGLPLLAPAAGTVVDVLNDLPDIPPLIAAVLPDPTATPVAAGPVHPAGNHVVIEVADNVFVLLGHMQQGSVSVAPGDTVAPGDPIGLVGNSGNTSEPHIHLHAQSTADMLDPATIGVPMMFAAALVDGELVDAAQPVQGQFVQQP